MAHILLVDDEEMIRELIKDTLDPHGYTFDTAADGLEALERIGKTRYDLVIIDRNMPRMSGMQAIARLRADPAHKDLKVIMCTSADRMGDVEDALELGANDYIVKPLNLQLLAVKVARQLGAATR